MYEESLASKSSALSDDCVFVVVSSKAAPTRARRAATAARARAARVPRVARRQSPLPWAMSVCPMPSPGTVPARHVALARACRTAALALLPLQRQTTTQSICTRLAGAPRPSIRPVIDPGIGEGLAIRARTPTLERADEELKRGATVLQEVNDALSAHLPALEPGNEEAEVQTLQEAAARKACSVRQAHSWVSRIARVDLGALAGSDLLQPLVSGSAPAPLLCPSGNSSQVNQNARWKKKLGNETHCSESMLVCAIYGAANEVLKPKGKVTDMTTNCNLSWQVNPGGFKELLGGSGRDVMKLSEVVLKFSWAAVAGWLHVTCSVAN
ncbi:hypothetical protein ACP4OV_028261 [Aristida adscensionis]